MVHTTCSVPGCEDKNSPRHRFPNPKTNLRVFNIWLKLCGNELLNRKDPELVYKNHRVCHIHFCKEDRSTNNSLKKDALPVVFVPQQGDVIKGAQVLFEHNYMDTNPNFITDNVHDSRTACANEPCCSKDLGLEMKTEMSVNNEFIVSEPSPSCSGIVVTTPPRSSLLREVGVTREKHLSPRCRKLYTRGNKLQKRVNLLKRMKGFYKNQAHALSGEEMIQNITKDLDPTVSSFINTQIHLCNKPPKGRRFALKDKLLGLMLHKQSNRAYKFLSKVFILPSKKTIMDTLKRIPIKSGLNDNVFQNLKDTIQNLPERHRTCALMFDEISIQPYINLNISTGEFEGFASGTVGRSDIIADHALVFLIKGVTKRWKQPIFYNFCRGSTSTENLKTLIIQIIRKCAEAGLRVIATICDQGTTNIAAINSLVGVHDDKTRKFFYVNGNKIVHIYDPPHLIKGIRNNLLTNDLVWIKDGRTLRASWADIYNAYKLDNASSSLRTMPKLTEGHVNTRKLRKMKVCCATQVFSHTVASVISLMAPARLQGIDGTTLSENAVHTAELLKFFNDLFDTVNGSSLNVKRGNIYRCAIKDGSQHLPFWRDAKKQLQHMHFVKRGSHQKFRPPSLINWVVTINSLEDLHKSLKDLGINFIRPRDFNQDAVENFFCQIRQQAGPNNNPTPSMFGYQFRILLINYLTTTYSLSANCEEDKKKFLLTSLEKLIASKINVESADMYTLNKTICVNENISYIDKISIGYVSGFITRNIKKLSVCGDCKTKIFCKDKTLEWHDLVVEKEFSNGIPMKMKYCTPTLMQYMCKVYNFTRALLPHVVCQAKALHIMISFINEHVCFPFNNSCGHREDIKKIILNSFVMFVCHNWCVGLNRVLRGQDDRQNRNDLIYKQARIYATKRRAKNRK